MSVEYRAWFEKYRPKELQDIILPNDTIAQTIKTFYDQEFIKGNILSYGDAGLGKTSLTEVLIHKIIKDRNDIFILGRRVEEVENLKRWLQQRAVGSNQKIVKIEEIDTLSYNSQQALKDGLLEKFQHSTTFIATTNHPEKVNAALLSRFNTKIQFGKLPEESLVLKISSILKKEKINFSQHDVDLFIHNHRAKGLRDIINSAELASITGTFKPESLIEFSGSSESESLVIQYVIYLIKYLEVQTLDTINKIISNPKSDEHFFTYYEYMLKVFKSDLSINFDTIYKELSDSDLDLTAKNIVNDFWQDLELKRFKSTHTVSLINSLMLNIQEQKGD